MSPASEGQSASLWLAAPPSMRAETDRLEALLDDLLALLRPYGVREIESSEPRRYRLTSRGRALLREALAAQRLESVQFDSSEAPTAGFASVLLDLGLGREWLPDLAVRLSVSLRPGSGAPAGEAGLQLAHLAARWFGPLRAASAFVSDRPGDAGPVTAHEHRQRQPALATWPAVCRYVRGVFWGMGLGTALCDRLGGQARVLREAPVAMARPLGDGVWLQLSASPPAEPPAYDRLAAYLDALLHWTMADLQARCPPPPPARHGGAGTAGPAGPAVPVRFLGPLDPDVAINVRLAASPTAAQRDVLERAMRAWYDEGFSGAFGGVGFHFLSGASVDAPGQTLRWAADLGSSDVRRALQALAERLGALDGVTVEQLTIGTEHVG